MFINPSYLVIDIGNYHYAHPQTKLWNVIWNYPVRPSEHFTCEGISSLIDELMLMKLHKVAIYKLRMCMKEDNFGLKYFKGDN